LIHDDLFTTRRRGGKLGGGQEEEGQRGAREGERTCGILENFYIPII
jgi:hypothetical protein